MTGTEVRVILPITTPGFRDDGTLDGLAGPQVRVTHAQITEGPASIECDLDEALAAPGVAARAVEAERAGADALVIDCMGDPGLDAAREVVSIPVLGPCQTSMHAAAMLGHRFSVVTVLDRLLPSFERRAASYGVAGTLASVRAVDVPVLDLEEQRELSTRRLVAESVAAVEEDGAHVIVFGCTGMLGWAEDIASGLAEAGHPGVPVIDPIPLTVRTAATLVASGLTHSKRSHPEPPAKARPGWAHAS